MMLKLQLFQTLGSADSRHIKKLCNTKNYGIKSFIDQNIFQKQKIRGFGASEHNK